MGKYIGQNLSSGVFTKQQILLERLNSGEFKDTYALSQRVANEAGMLVVCDRMILRPVDDYIVVQDTNTFEQKIKIEQDVLTSFEDLDEIFNNVNVYIVYLGKELLQTSLASIDNAHDVVISAPTEGQILKYDGTNWVNADSGSIGSGYTGLEVRVSNLEIGAVSKTYLNTKLGELINGAPETLDTLKEIADALGQDQNFSTTILTQLGGLDTRITSLENAPDPASALDDLTDVTLSAPSNGQTIKYDGSGWINSSISAGDITGLATVANSGAYSDLSGTPTLATVATSGSYNDLADKPSFSSDLDGLTDVTITSATNGQVLQYNGTAWVNGAAPSTFSGSYTDLTNKPTIPSTLDDLSDVAVSSATKGQFIVHNGSSFINSNIIEASGASVKPLIIKAAASQTANLLEIQDSSSTVLTSVDAAGTLTTKRYVEVSTNSFDSTLSPSSGTLTIDTSVGNAVFGVLDASVTTWDFTNVPTDNNRVTTVTVVIAGNTSYIYGDVCTVNGASITDGVKWSGGFAPDPSSGTDIIIFIIAKDNSGTIKVFGSATTNFS